MSGVTPQVPRFLDREALVAQAFGRLGATTLAGLHVAGSLAGLARPTVAVVGTRAPSEQGQRLARRLARELTAAGVCVISGLALGIDATAHEGALEAGGPTIGVLGSGHARFFPARNAGLAQRMLASGGAVLSPYAPDQPAYPWQFLARNGVVAALADAVVVVEAAVRSGALNTASWAADRGVPVLAFPGDVERPKVAGCLALIRDGAILARDAADVLAELGIAIAKPATSARAQPLAPPCDTLGRVLWDRLASGPAHADVLVAASGLGPAAVLGRLAELVAEERVREEPDGRFRRLDAH